MPRPGPANTDFDRDRRSRSIRYGGLVLLVAAGALRLAAAGGDLAIDEIWSWWLVKNAIGRLAEVASVRLDNNHILNTVVIYALGPDVPGVWYRIPGVIASTATVWLGSRIAARRDPSAAGSTACFLIAGSYLMILYGTEARGYTYLVLFACLSWLCLLRAEAAGRRSDAIAFAVSASLGFLAHLTFVYCYAGFFVWTACKYRSPRFRLLLAAHVLPIAIAVSLYLFFIRGMEIGGGRKTTLLSGIVSTLSLIAGGPLSGNLAPIAALLVAVLIAWGLIRLWKHDRALATCYGTIIVLVPAAVLMWTGHSLVYPRYFLVPIAFALLVISDLIAGWWRSGRTGQLGSLAVCLVYLVANGGWTVRLLDHGRGDYSRAIAWIASQAQDRDQTVGSDHDFRNGMIFNYYASRLGSPASRLHYVDQEDVPRHGTDWMILHDFDGDAARPRAISDGYGNIYHSRRTFRHRSLTGFNWWLYRRAGTPNNP
jgi:hypothetical protein